MSRPVTEITHCANLVPTLKVGESVVFVPNSGRSHEVTLGPETRRDMTTDTQRLFRAELILGQFNTRVEGILTLRYWPEYRGWAEAHFSPDEGQPPYTISIAGGWRLAA